MCITWATLPGVLRWCTSMDPLTSCRRTARPSQPMGREIGWVASSAHHFEEGPIATVVVKRSTPTDAILHVALSADPDDESPVSVLGSQTPVVSA